MRSRSKSHSDSIESKDQRVSCSLFTVNCNLYANFVDESSVALFTWKSSTVNVTSHHKPYEFTFYSNFIPSTEDRVINSCDFCSSSSPHRPLLLPPLRDRHTSFTREPVTHTTLIMPEVQGASVKQIDLSHESAHPGDLKPSYSCLCTSVCTDNKYTSPNVSLIPVTSSKVASSDAERRMKVIRLTEHTVNDSSIKSDRIIKRHNAPYLYIASGDFAIVWPNVIVFTIASALYLLSIYAVTTTKDHTLQKTWMFCE